MPGENVVKCWGLACGCCWSAGSVVGRWAEDWSPPRTYTSACHPLWQPFAFGKYWPLLHFCLLNIIQVLFCLTLTRSPSGKGILGNIVSSPSQGNKHHPVCWAFVFTKAPIHPYLKYCAYTAFVFLLLWNLIPWRHFGLLCPLLLSFAPRTMSGIESIYWWISEFLGHFSRCLSMYA